MIKVFSQPVPDSTIGLLLVIGFLLSGWVLYKIFGDVEEGKRRYLLQNAVYRMYQLHRWITAVVTGIVVGIDSGVNAYYATIAKTKIAPLNERKFAPTLKHNPEPIEPVQAHVPVAVAAKSRGWLRRIAS